MTVGGSYRLAKKHWRIGMVGGAFIGSNWMPGREIQTTNSIATWRRHLSSIKPNHWWGDLAAFAGGHLDYENAETQIRTGRKRG